MSDDFAFGASDPSSFAQSAASHGADDLLVAADLESLLANPGQAERFVEIVTAVRARGNTVSSPTPPPKLAAAEVVESSSWSDHEEQMVGGHTSDTRWTGLRRSDGRVVGRAHRRGRISQMWKHAFTLATTQVETAVRRTARELLPGRDDDWKRDVLRRLAVAYGRHLWRDHYRRQGLSTADTDLGRAVSFIAGELDPEAAAFLARGYVTMLMGLRSDPRFWEGPDTRVTFQNVACLVRSLLDCGEACVRAGKRELQERLQGVLRASLLEFAEAHGRQGLSELQGAEGWETLESAWLESLQSEVPRRSKSDVVGRATLFAIGGTLPAFAEDPSAGECADTGHIAGEMHGAWENPGWCEHRA
jgi:hypothetical protein